MSAKSHSDHDMILGGCNVLAPVILSISPLKGLEWPNTKSSSPSTQDVWAAWDPLERGVPVPSCWDEKKHFEGMFYWQRASGEWCQGVFLSAKRHPPLVLGWVHLAKSLQYLWGEGGYPRFLKPRDPRIWEERMSFGNPVPRSLVIPWAPS